MRTQGLYAFRKVVIDILTSVLLDYNLVLSGLLRIHWMGGDWARPSWSRQLPLVCKHLWSGVQKITFLFVCKWQRHVFTFGCYLIEPCRILFHGMTQNIFLGKESPFPSPTQRSFLKEVSSDYFMDGIYWQTSFPLQAYMLIFESFQFLVSFLISEFKTWDCLEGNLSICECIVLCPVLKNKNKNKTKDGPMEIQGWVPFCGLNVSWECMGTLWRSQCVTW